MLCFDRSFRINGRLLCMVLATLKGLRWGRLCICPAAFCLDRFLRIHGSGSILCPMLLAFRGLRMLLAFRGLRMPSGAFICFFFLLLFSATILLSHELMLVSRQFPTYIMVWPSAVCCKPFSDRESWFNSVGQASRDSTLSKLANRSSRNLHTSDLGEL